MPKGSKICQNKNIPSGSFGETKKSCFYVMKIQAKMSGFCHFLSVFWAFTACQDQLV